MRITIEAAKQEALDHYETWGNVAVECWEDTEWAEAIADWPEAVRLLKVVHDVRQDWLAMHQAVREGTW